MKKAIEINRRTIIGFGYTASVERSESGGLQVCKTTRPDYTGTIRQVSDAIDSDRTLASFDSGGTYYSTAWFVKHNGKFYEINPGDDWRFYDGPRSLLETYKDSWGDTVYLKKSITVEIEINAAAAALGSIRTERKARSSAENGKKGGRPKTK